jgi:methylmalonyl-CoA mutase cobalamin-binding subunit
LKDHLGGLTLKSRFYRLAQDYEELRLRVENKKIKPKVYIALYGDYSTLNARLNFVKNYFELLGLEVSDPGNSVMDKKEFSEALKNHVNDIVVVCSNDDLYPEVIPFMLDLGSKDKFIAGKVEVPGFQNLFAGQDTYKVLSGLVTKWGNA